MIAALPCRAPYPPCACCAAAAASAAPWQPRGVLMAHLAEHRRAITRVAVAGGGAFFVTASADETCKARGGRYWLPHHAVQQAYLYSRALPEEEGWGAAWCLPTQLHATSPENAGCTQHSVSSFLGMHELPVQCSACISSAASLAAMHVVCGARSMPCLPPASDCSGWTWGSHPGMHGQAWVMVRHPRNNATCNVSSEHWVP